MRAVFAFALLIYVLGWGAAPAAAETELAVLPPVGKGAGEVKAALAKARVGTLATKAIDASCASDP